MNDSVGPIEPINPTAPPVYGVGEFDVRMRIYEDNFFLTPITNFPYQVSKCCVLTLLSKLQFFWLRELP